MPIQGKIARVISPTEVVLNVGARGGVTRGMVFVIYAEGTMVRDPVTGEDLERVEIVKGRVTVADVQDSVSVAHTVPRQVVKYEDSRFQPGELQLSVAKWLGYRYAARREVEYRQDQLQVDEATLEPLSDEQRKVRPGDLVREEAR